MLTLTNCFIFLSLILGSFSGFTHLDGIELSPSYVIYQRFGAYKTEDSPFGLGNNAAAVLYNMHFTMKANKTFTNTTFGEVLVFHSSIKDEIGVGNGLLKKIYCCSRDLFQAGKCDRQNALIFTAKDTNKFHYANLTRYSYRSHGVANLNQFYQLRETGIWYIFIANCADDWSTISDLSITGVIEWVNPFGYLPGQILGYLPMYWILAIGYIVVGILWGIASCIHYKDLMDFQIGIAFVITVCIAENLLWASDYTAYNKNGLISDWANVFGALFTSTKLTSIRTLMLLVAIGYTITRPVLSPTYKIGVAIITVLYFILEAANQYITVIKTAGDIVVSENFGYFVIFCLLVVNGIFFGWIGFEMFFTTSRLKKNETKKFDMYKRLSILLIFSITLSVAIILTQIIIEAKSKSDEYFRSWWLFESYWEFIYFACLLYVAWIWRPNEENNRYAYKEVDAGSDNDSVELEEGSHTKDDSGVKKDVKAVKLDDSGDTSSSEDVTD